MIQGYEEARAELDHDKRKTIYADMGSIVHNDGGVIVPMFNDFIDAIGPKVGGWKPNGNEELMGGYALSKCWITA